MERTVLYVVHNHPTVMPGGAETYALELYRAMENSPGYTPVLLARTGPPVSKTGRVHEGTLLEPVGDDPNQYFFHTDITEYDWFMSTSRNKDMLTKFYRPFLEAYRPDVVHFQHSLFFGYDMLRETRRTLPDAAIVYTLHEYLPICNNNGQLYRTSGEPCTGASPRRCHECFPDISPQQFFLRERFIKSHFDVVDKFVSPSKFLVERYVDWGIDRDRILYEENGRPTFEAHHDDDRTGARDRFAYFGQFTAFKGADVLLQAMKIASERHAPKTDSTGVTSDGPRPKLRLHGANLEHQPEQFRTLIASLLATAGDDVTSVGRYRPRDLPPLMAAVDWVVVPSIWYENAPLVIQEAFAHGRPVICSDIGGMAEKVTDGVNGLHFRAGDPASLAEVMTKALTTPGLWEHLRAGIPAVHQADAHAARLRELYEDVLARKADEPLRESSKPIKIKRTEVPLRVG
jgi:glycosyltransferase involved in cell wall biosynthesis